MAKFSKQHYEDIARIFRNFRPPTNLLHDQRDSDIVLDHLLTDFVAMFMTDNDKFNVDKFAKASREKYN